MVWEDCEDRGLLPKLDNFPIRIYNAPLKKIAELTANVAILVVCCILA